MINAIKAAPANAKFFVIAGHAHIAEDMPGDVYSTMAMEFKKKSGINPFTIDQLTSLEEYEHTDNSLIGALSKRIKLPKVLWNINNAIQVSYLHYDAFIIHPSTQLSQCRPDWLTCNDRKSAISIRCDYDKAIFVQAYYKNEITSAQSYKTRIPADQTFYLDANGFAHLFLIPGFKYVIVFRDEDNKIIKTQTVTI